MITTSSIIKTINEMVHKDYEPCHLSVVAQPEWLDSRKDQYELALYYYDAQIAWLGSMQPESELENLKSLATFANGYIRNVSENSWNRNSE